MDVRVGPWRGLSTEELMLLNCGVGEDSWESLGLQGDPTSQSLTSLPEYSLEGKVELQYLGHLIWRADALDKTLMLGKIESRRRRGRQDETVGWPHQLNGHEFEWALGYSEEQSYYAAVRAAAKSWTQLSNWTTILWESPNLGMRF